MSAHDLEHALYAHASGCSCKMAEITNCVICEKRLEPDRQHVDTCGPRCFSKLCERQRAARAA